jgi:tRNA(fMet)-specific endonuclease VapC
MLDTNICIYIIKNRPQSVKERFRAYHIGELCISSITVSELMYGAYKSQHIEKNLKAIEAFLLPFEIVEYDYNAAVAYGQIRATLEKKGQGIGGMDMQIAGHALALDMVVVTNNTKEFQRIEGLALENWV